MVFLTVYQREPHARQMGFDDIVQPKDYDERCQLAERTRDELELHDATILVDGMDDQSRELFGDLPSPAIVIGPDGLILDKLPWAEPAVLGPRLHELVTDATTARLAAGERTPREGLVQAIAAARSQGAPTSQELDRLADAVAALDEDQPELAALGLAELVRHTSEPGLFGVAEGAGSSAFATDPVRHAALLASLAEAFRGDPRIAAVLDRLDDLAGGDRPQQRGWVRVLRRELRAADDRARGSGVNDRGR